MCQKFCSEGIRWGRGRRGQAGGEAVASSGSHSVEVKLRFQELKIPRRWDGVITYKSPLVASDYKMYEFVQ